MKKSIHKITRFSDESLAGQWLRTGRNDYIAALLLRHIHYIYPFFLKTAPDSAKAMAEVRLFIQRFPSLLQKYGGSEDFASWLAGELEIFHGELHAHKSKATGGVRKGRPAKISDTDNSNLDDRPADIADYPKIPDSDICPDDREGTNNGRYADDDGYADAIGELEIEIKSAYPTQNKGNAGVIILVAAVIAAVLAACLFLIPTCKSPLIPKPGVVAEAPAADVNAVESGESDGSVERGGPGEPIASDGYAGAVSGNGGAGASQAGTESVPQTGTPGTSQSGGAVVSQTAANGHEGRVRLVSISESPDSQSGGGGPNYVSLPKIGLKAYNEYLNKASIGLEEPVRGEVTISFNVNRYGRPSQIRVTGMLTREAHRESIRLLENGPEWSPAEIPVTIVMRFE